MNGAGAFAAQRVDLCGKRRNDGAAGNWAAHLWADQRHAKSGPGRPGTPPLGGAHANGYQHAPANGNRHAQPHANRSGAPSAANTQQTTPNAHAHTDADANPNGLSNGDAFTHPNGHTHRYPNALPIANGNTIPNANANHDANANANHDANANWYEHPLPNPNAVRYANYSNFANFAACIRLDSSHSSAVAWKNRAHLCAIYKSFGSAGIADKDALRIVRHSGLQKVGEWAKST